jgi:hypothetical protein
VPVTRTPTCAAIFGAKREAAAEEVARVEHRLAAVQFPDDEQGDGGKAAEQCRERGRVAPAAPGPFDRAVDDRRQSGDGEERSDRVEPRRARFAGGGHDRERAGQRETREDDVEREDRRPGEEVEQDAGGEQADDGAAGGDTDPGAACLAALLGREDGRDHRERDGHDQRRRDTHRRLLLQNS